MPEAEAPPIVELAQVERYEFRVRYPGHAYGPTTVDEPGPIGRDAGPDPVHALAAAIGHCLSSTLVSTLERAHIPFRPVETTVRAEVGRNAAGRRRVLALAVEIATAPLEENDRERFEHCVTIFEDYCTVSGAVRQGVPIRTHVGATAAVPPGEAGGVP